MSLDRRKFLTGLGVGSAGLMMAGGVAAQAADRTAKPGGTAAPADLTRERGTVLYTIGTKGGPRVGGRRSNPANLLMVDGVPFVIDCGYGVSRGLVDAGLPLDKLKYVFITHHHSDHNLEYGNLFYNGWVTNLRTPVKSYGPEGLEQMTRDFWALNRIDVATRMADEGRVDPRALLQATDLSSPGPVVELDGVRVSCVLTPHPPLKHCLAYRFQTPHGAVVFTGDTAYNPALADFAKGANVLVHEVVYPPGVDKLVEKVGTDKEAFKHHLLGAHTTPEDAGRIAQAAGVQTLVLSHFVPGDMDWITDAMWQEGAAKHFKGQVIVARDRQRIPVG